MTPYLGESASIDRILLWNLKDLEFARGNWTDVTREGLHVFGLDNSSVVIAQDHPIWYGHVVKIYFNVQNPVKSMKSVDEEKLCVAIKFEEMLDPYPFDIQKWRKQVNTFIKKELFVCVRVSECG